MDRVTKMEDPKVHLYDGSIGVDPTGVDRGSVAQQNIEAKDAQTRVKL